MRNILLKTSKVSALVLSICLFVFGFSLSSCASTGNFMQPVMGETDMELLESSVPIAVKGAEIAHFAKPKNKTFASVSSMLYVMYANVFVQSPAEFLPSSEYVKQNSEKQRAKMHYLRGRDYGMDYFNIKYKHFTEYITSSDPKLREKALKKIHKKDVSAAYWLGAGWLGAFALDPLSPDMLSDLRTPVLILERALELNPEYSNGAIYDVLCAFYAAAPYDFGGDKAKAVEYWLKEVEINKGQGTGILMTYANSLCKGNVPLDNFEFKCKYSFEEMGWDVPPIVHDEFLDSIGMGRKADTKWPLPIGVDGFDWALNKVINGEDDPNAALMQGIAKKKARYLEDHRDNYFVIW